MFIRRPLRLAAGCIRHFILVNEIKKMDYQVISPGYCEGSAIKYVHAKLSGQIAEFKMWIESLCKKHPRFATPFKVIAEKKQRVSHCLRKKFLSLKNFQMIYEHF